MQDRRQGEERRNKLRLALQQLRRQKDRRKSLNSAKINFWMERFDHARYQA